MEMDRKSLTHKVILVNDDKISGELVFYSIQLFFLTLTDNDIKTVMKSAETHGKWPMLLSTEIKCQRAFEYFKALGVPVEFEKINYNKD